MAEISRKDAINSIFATEECNSKMGNCYHKCVDCELFYLRGTTEDYKCAIKKAISDMEKLEKIEQILKHGDNKCVKCDPECEHFHFDERYCEIIHRYDLIEQIIKG